LRRVIKPIGFNATVQPNDIVGDKRGIKKREKGGAPGRRRNVEVSKSAPLRGRGGGKRGSSCLLIVCSSVGLESRFGARKGGGERGGEKKGKLIHRRNAPRVLLRKKDVMKVGGKMGGVGRGKGKKGLSFIVIIIGAPHKRQNKKKKNKGGRGKRKKTSPAFFFW